MPEVASVRLTGWKAALVGGGVLVAVAWGFVSKLQAVPAAGREALQAWLVEDYTVPNVHQRAARWVREHPGIVAGASITPGPAADAGAESSAPPETAGVTIDALDAHGWKDFQIARATVTARRGDAAPVHAVRYLSLSRGVAGRWTVFGESTAWRYWYVLVPAPRNGSSWP